MILNNFSPCLNNKKYVLEKSLKISRNNKKFENSGNFQTYRFFSFEKKVSKEKIKWSRGTYIVPKHIGRVFFIHNGKFYISVQISPKMLGHKFGEFALTRKTFHKKKNLLKNTKKKK